MPYSGLATLTGDAVRYSNIQAVVPLEYAYGIGSATQSYLTGNESAMDRNLNTSHLVATDFGISYARECKPAFVFLANWDGTSAGGVLCSTDGTSLQFHSVKGDWAHTRGNASTYTFPSVIVFTKSGDGDPDMFLYRLNVAVNPEGFRHLVNGTSNTTICDSCFTLDLPLRMYSDFKVEYSYNDIVIGSRTDAGMINPNFGFAKSNQMIIKWSFEWKELTSGEYLEFVEFFKAFGGNIGSPWYMCRQNGDINNSMEVLELAIEPKSISSSYDPKDGTWSVSFSAVEMRVNY